eukprot:2455359-Pleurochrysis_carterae.AAC.2
MVVAITAAWAAAVGGSGASTNPDWAGTVISKGVCDSRASVRGWKRRGSECANDSREVGGGVGDGERREGAATSLCSRLYCPMTAVTLTGGGSCARNAAPSGCSCSLEPCGSSSGTGVRIGDETSSARLDERDTAVDATAAAATDSGTDSPTPPTSPTPPPPTPTPTLRPGCVAVCVVWLAGRPALLASTCCIPSSTAHMYAATAHRQIVPPFGSLVRARIAARETLRGVTGETGAH